MPLTRLIVMRGWRPGRIADPRLLDPIPGPKIAHAVEPPWKFWVDASLRKPTDVSIEGLIASGVTPKIDATFTDPGGGHAGAT